MSKKEDFKSFVSKHPNLVSVVKEKKHSWQDLFEVYDLYGEDETLWERYLNNQETTSSSSNVSGISELTKLFKNVNIENVQKYIDTAQKAIGIVQQLTGNSQTSATVTKGPELARPINKIFED